MDRLALLILCFVSLCFLLPQPSFAQSTLTDTDLIHYHGGMDRLALGETTAAVPLFRKQIRKTPQHDTSVLRYFRYWAVNKTDTEIRREMEKFVFPLEEPRLLFKVLKETPVSKTGKFSILTQYLLNHSPSELLFHELLLLAESQGRTRFIEVNLPLVENTYRNSFNPVLFYAKWLTARGDIERASKLYQRLISLRPGHPAGYKGMAQYHEHAGNPVQARMARERYKALREALDKREPFARPSSR